MYVDNQATVDTSQLLDQISNRNRHIETRYFKICDHVESNEIALNWIPGSTNPSDINTKPLSATEIAPHTDFLLAGRTYSQSVMGGCPKTKARQAKLALNQRRSELATLAAVPYDPAQTVYLN